MHRSSIPSYLKYAIFLFLLGFKVVKQKRTGA
uniref:Uncharacterized protein n=1 Tax=Rhizophora mucronata TaxID=61149 RepID=A0A2P2QRQ4_RHIMU